MELSRGDIYFSQLNHITGNNSIQKGERPCIIISNDACNKYSPIVTVVVGTSEINKCKLPTHFILSPSCGLEKHTLFMAEQIMPVPKSSLLFKAGKVPDHLMHVVDRAISVQNGTLEPFNIHKVRQLLDEIAFIDNLFKKYKMETEEESLLRESCVKQLEVYCKQYDYDYTKFLKGNNVVGARGVAACV